MNHILAVGIGGCLGSLARYWLSGVAQRQFQGEFPFGTLAVNVLGCLVLGYVMGLVEFRQFFGPTARLFLTVGLMGGFTTFSAFGYETFALLRDSQWWFAMANVAANTITGIVAVLAGWFVAKLV